MPFIIGKIKCYFCENDTGLMYSINQFGLYGQAGKRIFYHPECLEMVELSPEKFGHKMMDKALHIHELEEKNKKINKTIPDIFKHKVDKLHRLNFERMMPKKG
jgi:hypothetical protein